MSEKNPSSVPPPAAAGGNGSVARPPAINPADTAAAKPSAPVAQPAAPPVKPPAAFGGHRGGGKKRADGLVAGSPEAIAADKEKDAARKREARAGKKVASLSPPLPGVAASPENAASPLADNPPADGGAVALAPVAENPAALPRFVEWTLKPIERLVKVATKIADRLRVAALMARVKKLGLDPATNAEAEKRIAYKAEQVNDFNAALANATVIELNKRRAPGAQHSHWLEVALTGGELVNSHLDTVDWLEKKLLEKAAREAKEKAAAKN